MKKVSKKEFIHAYHQVEKTDNTAWKYLDSSVWFDYEEIQFPEIFYRDENSLYTIDESSIERFLWVADVNWREI